MNKGKLKQAKIEGGKISLEGRIIENPEFLSLKTLSVVLGLVSESEEKHKEKLYRDIESNKPERADTYVLGEPMHQVVGMTIGGYYPVMYLNSKME